MNCLGIGCRVYDDVREFFKDEVLRGFDRMIFDGGLRELRRNDLIKIGDCLFAIKKEDLDFYYKFVTGFGLGEDEMHPCDWYRVEFSDVCQRAVFL